MDKKRRNRAPNWEQTEKNLFKELMKDVVSVVENKNTDTNTNKAKVNAWSNIFNRFNELNTRQRTLNELKQQWRVIKGETKKCISTYQRELKKTGGGPKPSSPNRDVLDIVELIPNEFTIDVNKFDSNSVVATSDYTVEIRESEELQPCFSGMVDITSNQEEQEVSCAEAIQSETSRISSTEIKRGIKRKLPLSENRNHAVQEIKKMARERNDLNCKMLEEDLKFKKIKYELEIQHMKEEMTMKRSKYNLKCDVLNLQKQLLEKQLKNI